MYAKSRKDKSRFWRAIAKEIDGSSRMSIVVNISKLSKVTKPGECVVVPGRVLATGELSHKLTIIALSFSKTAIEKLKGKATIALLPDLLSGSIKEKGMRIIK